MWMDFIKGVVVPGSWSFMAVSGLSTVMTAVLRKVISKKLTAPVGEDCDPQSSGLVKACLQMFGLSRKG